MDTITGVGVDLRHQLHGGPSCLRGLGFGFERSCPSGSCSSWDQGIVSCNAPPRHADRLRKFRELLNQSEAQCIVDFSEDLAEESDYEPDEKQVAGSSSKSQSSSCDHNRDAAESIAGSRHSRFVASGAPSWGSKDSTDLLVPACLTAYLSLCGRSHC